MDTPESLRARLAQAIARSCIGADNLNYALQGLSIQDGKDLLAELATERSTREASAKQLTEAEAALTALKPYVHEVMTSHRDKDSCDYNGCENAECAWCEGVRTALAAVSPTKE